jgi:hypothetical protein
MELSKFDKTPGAFCSDLAERDQPAGPRAWMPELNLAAPTILIDEVSKSHATN